MFNLIIRTLRRVGVKLVLKETHLESYLNYYSVDFIDKYDNWCNLTLFYNDTHFFVDNIKLIGKGRKEIYTDAITNSIVLKGKYDDFISSKRQSPSKEELDDFLVGKIKEKTEEVYNLAVGEFKIKEVKFYSNPTLMVFVFLTYKGVRIEPIRIFIGEKISYNGNQDGIDLLLESLERVLCYDKLFRPNRPM